MSFQRVIPTLREMVEDGIRASHDTQEAADFVLRILKAEREACARAACPACRRGLPVEQVTEPGIRIWRHLLVGDEIPCAAGGIRDLPEA